MLLQAVAFDGDGCAVAVVGFGDGIGDGLDEVRGIAHGHADSCIFYHVCIIVSVSKSNDFFSGESENFQHFLNSQNLSAVLRNNIHTGTIYSSNVDAVLGTQAQIDKIKGIFYGEIAVDGAFTPTKENTAAKAAQKQYSDALAAWAVQKKED